MQRISKILTAPSRLNSDEDYWRMKKLFVRVNASEKYEREREAKKRAETFERIQSTGAYYNHKIWEEDYQRQVYCVDILLHLFVHLAQCSLVCAFFGRS